MYDPAEYWEKRLSQNFDLTGVGHQSFGRIYNRLLYLRKGLALRRVFKPGDLKGKKVLDVGAGTGFFVGRFLRDGAVTDGLDISATAVNLLRERYPGGRFFLHDCTLRRPDFENLYDIVNAWDVVYHQVDDRRFGAFLENVSAWLRPGGLFLATDDFGTAGDRQAAPHVKFRSVAAYEALLKSGGFHLVHKAPLYEMLNRRIALLGKGKWKYEMLAPIIFLWDVLTLTTGEQGFSGANMSLAVWQKTAIAPEC